MAIVNSMSLPKILFWVWKTFRRLYRLLQEEMNKETEVPDN